MKDYLSADGERRLWFDPEEIEQIMGAELRRSGVFPEGTEATPDLEALLEQGLGVKLDLYARLEPDVLGVTEFRCNSNPIVSVNAELTAELDEPEPSSGGLGRWRATLAHEASHVILHRVLFDVPSGQRELFTVISESRPNLFRCLKRDMAFGGSNRYWKEVQANMGMAALLMHAEVFSDTTRIVVGASTHNSVGVHMPASDSHEYEDVVFELSRRFKVSRQAARIRLTSLGLERRATKSMADRVPR